jgi:S-DNA-T family DNA segregation ATPase FtsK/SpoIIIE
MDSLWLPANRGMKILGPTRHNRLNEAAAFVYAFAGVFMALSLVSYYPQDPSWNTAVGAVRAHNLTGVIGAHAADLLFQVFGLTAFGLPLLIWALAWKWIRSQPIEAAWVRVGGSTLLLLSVSAGASLITPWRPWHGAFASGGIIGTLLADYLVVSLNPLGTALVTGVCLILSLYLLSTFSMTALRGWLSGPRRAMQRIGERWSGWRARRRAKAAERARLRQQKREARRMKKAPVEVAGAAVDLPPWESRYQPVEEFAPAGEPEPEEIPIHTLEYAVPEPPPAKPAEPEAAAATAPRPRKPGPVESGSNFYEIPSTRLLNEPQARNPYDGGELKEIAARIKSRFDEFNVLGSVVQINPGPVVTTFEYKPEAGIKYSRITSLSEDLCLGLQAESILIERIPGKPTVGIEVPNSKREVISLRQILESDEFQNSTSRLTICLGKDISGRIKVAALESMPHLLIAGSTGSGKSVMLNSLIMSVLFKSTPDEVRMIMVDPKRVELGMYEGVPHLLTPVITDPKKATNALRNAVFEMERRLKLLASQGVRNVDQFNKKVRQLQAQPRNLFEEEDALAGEDELRPLPYILIIIDELADLMMVERSNVEEAVTRLAQMARAVGMHLVLATQRPSVDVITGLIKANFPSRISFRVATRVDSRTVLDVMGAEHLLGKGDMLFLPPGSSRLVRVHGAFVAEAEINHVVDFWKAQAEPDYDPTFLLTPPSPDGADEEDGEVDGPEDPLYQEAVRVVLEMGKASTSILQRRLRLGYGRAARILDVMQRDGIIGPPDGSRPREVLKRPDWLSEVESSAR